MEIDKNFIDLYLNNSINKADKTKNNTVNLPYAETTSQIKIEQKYDVFINNEIKGIKTDFEKTKSQQGLIGNIWDNTKNFFGLKSGSKYVESQIKAFKEGKITKESVQKALDSYKQGQVQVVDVVADLFSASAAAACYAAALGGAVAAPFTGGASLGVTAAAIAGATAAGAATKTLIKGFDAKIGGRNYTYKDCLTDAAMGAINGPLAAATAGAGLLVAKAGTKIGMPIAKAALASMENQVVVGLGKATTKATVIETAIWANAHNVNRNITMSVSKEAMKKAPLSEIRKTGQFLFEYLRTNTGEKLSKGGLKRLTAIVTQWTANTSSTPLLGGAKIGLGQKIAYNIANGAFIGAVFGAGTSANDYTVNSVANNEGFSLNSLIEHTFAGMTGGAVFGAASSAGGTVIGEAIHKVKALPKGGNSNIQGKAKLSEAKPSKALIKPNETGLTKAKPAIVSPRPTQSRHIYGITIKGANNSAVPTGTKPANINTPKVNNGNVRLSGLTTEKRSIIRQYINLDNISPDNLEKLSEITYEELVRVKKIKNCKGLSTSDLLRLVKMSDEQLANIEKRQLLANYDKLRFEDCEAFNIVESLSRLSDSKYKKYCSLLKDPGVMGNEEIKFRIIRLAESNNTQEIINFMQKYPNIDFSIVDDYLINADKNLFPYIDEIYSKGNYSIEKLLNNELKIKNNSTNLPIVISVNSDTASFRIMTKNQNGDVIARLIVKSPEGIYISAPVTGTLEEINAGTKEIDIFKSFKKVDLSPEDLHIDKLEDLVKQKDIKGEIVYKINSPIEMSHAEFDLPQGKTVISESNGTTIMQMDNALKPNSTSERIVYHYPDGRVASVDFGLDSVSVLEPNNAGTGMTEIYTVGDQEINLTSEIKDGLIQITNNKTGKKLTTPLSSIIDAKDFDASKFGLEGALMGNVEQISAADRSNAITKTFRELTPTTILDLLKYKRLYPEAKLPYLKDRMDSFCAGAENTAALALSDSPHVVTHEALHSVTDYRNLANSPLKDIHLKEAKANTGLIGKLSEYATDGQQCDYERGLHELLSIGGTMSEYGTEMGFRAEATRLAFPETLKEAAKVQMQHHQELIDEMIERRISANAITITPESISAPIKPQKIKFMGFLPPQKWESSLRDKYGNFLTNGKQRELAIGELCDQIRKGGLKIADTNQILDIWSWRKYNHLLEEQQLEFFRRINEICENSKIDVHDGEIFIRTVPVLGMYDRNIGFSLGEPKKEFTKPAAAARAQKLKEPLTNKDIEIEIEGKNAKLSPFASILPYEVIYRIIDDKQHWLSTHPKDKITSSTVYIIDPQGYKTLTGFDWEKTGVVGPYKDGGNGFGCRVFLDHATDIKSGLSTEVVFSGNTKFIMKPNEPVRNASIFYPGIGNIKIKVVYVIPTN